MSNGNTHLLAGVICGVVISPVIQNKLHEKNDVEIGHLVLCASTGLIGGRIPDILEPPLNPNHRAFFHSIIFGLILCLGLKELWKKVRSKVKDRKLRGETIITGSEFLLALIFVGLIAVLLHLVMDSFTKKSLPFI